MKASSILVYASFFFLGWSLGCAGPEISPQPEAAPKKAPSTPERSATEPIVLPKHRGTWTMSRVNPFADAIKGGLTCNWMDRSGIERTLKLESNGEVVSYARAGDNLQVEEGRWVIEDQTLHMDLSEPFADRAPRECGQPRIMTYGDSEIWLCRGGLQFDCQGGFYGSLLPVMDGSTGDAGTSLVGQALTGGRITPYPAGASANPRSAVEFLFDPDVDGAFAKATKLAALVEERLHVDGVEVKEWNGAPWDVVVVVGGRVSER